MTAAEYAQGLRDFADWIEEHAVAFDGVDLRDEMRMLLYCTSREEFATKAKLVGYPSAETIGKLSEEYFSIDRHFGPVKVHVYTAREIVCQPVTETVEQERWIFDATVLTEEPAEVQ